MQYVIPAFALSCVLYLLIGSMIYNEPVASLSSGADADGGQGLLMLIPMAVVVTVAIMQRTIFEALTYGIIVGIVVALLGGLITPKTCSPPRVAARSGYIDRGCHPKHRHHHHDHPINGRVWRLERIWSPRSTD